MGDFMTTIGRVAEIFDGPHATPEKIDEGPFFLSISSLENGRLDLSKSAHLSEVDFKKWTKRVTPRKGDLLFSYETRLGEAALMPDGVRACLGRRMGLLRPRAEKVIPEYLLYAYLSPAFQQTIFANTITGATVDRIALNEMPDFGIRIPGLEEQKKVASLLNKIDAKIDCNNRINAELEAMAKTLYDYWFVQFDFPDANGKPYKSSGGKMVYNATLKKEIPAGWRHSTIGETFKTHLGGTPSREKKEYWTPSEVNWLSSGENPSTFVVDPDERISNLGLQNSPAKLLPEGTVILSIVRHLRASILGIEAATNQSVVGIVESSAFKHCFIYPYLVREIPRLTVLRTGAQQPHINKGVLDESLLVVPDESTLEAYTSLAAPLFLQIKNYHQQNRELTQLRDWLLPMLMNGQVTVA
ncbi:MAG: restriction endonuclease subunit S [Candidatus Nitrotoga sp.]|nr:restriction endonuclease subunit S [Candidatus Nitrotoga sp.]MDO9446736.1 restriction endonuclease subunit S [Candidatus Nitrotoga sp.]MDP1638963.1 restriction endonuclease subunit S [Candidatus Nitrotoga sp.]